MSVHIPPGFAQFSVEHWLESYLRPAVTTIGVKLKGTVNGENIDAVTQVFYAYTNAFSAGIDSNVTMRNARLVIGQDAGEPVIQDGWQSVKGAASRESVAPALALMITKSTGVGGRRNRGRMYLPWAIGDTGVDERGAINNANLDPYVIRAQTFLTNLAGSEPLGAYDLLDGAYLLHSALDAEPTAITALIPNPTIRTQTQRQARY